MDEATRRTERIEVELPCRLFIPGRDGLRFEAFARSANLALGGVFVASSFLLRTGTVLHVELGLPDGALAVRGRIAHTVAVEDREHPSGMGIEFVDVDARGREALLRYFTPARYARFHAAFAKEFPHLEKELPLRDVSLVLNLWEEWKIRNEGGPLSTASGAPPATVRSGRPAPAAISSGRSKGRR